MAEKNKLGLKDTTLVVISLVIGMGIFRTSKDVAEVSTESWVFFAAWIIGGLVAICGALTYAEIGSRYPVMGGYYKIFSETYHPSIAFSVNCIILVSNAASLVGVALIGIEYLNYLSPYVMSKSMQTLCAGITIVAFYLLNMYGFKLSTTTQKVLMGIKISLLLLVIVCVFGAPSTAATSTEVLTPNYPWWKSLGLSLVAVSFTYGGYQQTINFGDDVANPARTMPKAIIMGMLIVIVLYLLAATSYHHIIGLEQMAVSSKMPIASRVMGATFGDAVANVFTAILFTAVLAYVNIILLSNPRAMYAMSMDGVLPKALSKKNTEKDTLPVGLTVFTIACLVVLVYAETFDRILKFSIFLDCIGMAFSAATIFYFRKIKKGENANTPVYKMKLYPILPIVFILTYCFVAIVIAIETPVYAKICGAVLAGFIAIYFLAKKLKLKA
jgi:basic amino acid/polyamine antiporter, APA family